MVDCAVRCRFSPCGKVDSLMALLEIFECILGENSLQLGNSFEKMQLIGSLDYFLDQKIQKRVSRFRSTGIPWLVRFFGPQ